MKPRSREINVFSMSALDLFASALGAFILLTVVIFPYFPNEGMVERAELEEILNELGEAAAESAELQRIHEELNGAIGSLQRELAACRGELAACREETLSQQAQAEEQQRQIEEQQRQIEEQQAQAGERQRQQRQIEEQQRQIEEQQAQARERQRQIGEQEDRIADLERRKFMIVTISWGGQSGDDVDLHVVDPNGREYYFSQRSYPGSDARFEEDSLNGPGNELWLQPRLTVGEYRIYYNPYSLESGSVEVRGRIVHSTAGHELRSRRLIAGGPRQLVAVVVVDGQSNITVRES